MIKLKDIIKESKLINLFEQAEQPDGSITKPGIGRYQTGILDWFQKNKNKTLTALDSAGIGPGSMYNNMPNISAGGRSETLGAGISVILNQYMKYQKDKRYAKGFNDAGEPITKITNKRGQWDAVAEKIPIKFNGYKWVAVNPLNTAFSVTAKPDRFLPLDFDKGVLQLNQINQAQFPRGQQIVDITPIQIPKNQDFKRKDDMLLVKAVENNMNGKAYQNHLKYGPAKNQLILWGNYKIETTAPTTGSADKIIDKPGQQFPPLNISGSSFQSNSAQLTPASVRSVTTLITRRIQDMRNAGVAIPAGIGTIVINSGTDSMPSNYGGRGNQGLAADRGATLQTILQRDFGIPSQIVTGGFVGAVPPGTTSWTNKPASVSRQQWIAAAAPARTVQMTFPSVQAPDTREFQKGEKPKAGTKRDFQDRTGTQYDKINVSDEKKQQDGYIWRVTVNMIK